MLIIFDVIDDPLTVGPETDSKTVGRAQGNYASASLTEVVLVYVFTEGKYNSSTLSPKCFGSKFTI